MFKIFLSCIALVAIFFSKPAYSEPVLAGPLELNPGNATIVMEASRARRPPYVMFHPTLKFSIKNRSSSDLKIIIISDSIDAYDNLNQKLIKGPDCLASSGAPLSSYRTDNQKIFIQDKSKFVSLSPGQEVQSYISVKSTAGLYVEDISGDFYKTHRPATMTFNGSIGIINIDGSTDVRAFSFSNVPASVSMR